MYSKENGVSTIAFSGKVGEGIEGLYEIGIKSIFSIMTGVSTLDEALKEGSRNLELTTENVVRLLK